MKNKNKMALLKKLRYMLEYSGVMTARRLVQILPHRMLSALADISALIIYVAPPFRKMLSANLKVAFPEKNPSEINCLAKKSFSNLVLAMLEFFWFVDRPDRLEKYTVYKDEALTFTKKNLEGKAGFIFVTPHLGNWELAGLACSEPIETYRKTANRLSLTNACNRSNRIETAIKANLEELGYGE